MNDGLVVILVIVVVGLGIVGAVFAHRQQKQRREQLAALAAGLGWSFEAGPEQAGREAAGAFSAFSRGHSQQRLNTLHGSTKLCGRPAAAMMGDFRYKVTSSNGKSTTTRTYNFSYLIVDVPLSGVPDLAVRREHLLDKIAGAIGFDDIDFESEEFSRKFFVKCPDRRFAYDVIHARMMEFLMADSPFAIEMRGGRICLTDGSSRWDPPKFGESLQWTRKFFDLWPEYLTQKFPARA